MFTVTGQWDGDKYLVSAVPSTPLIIAQIPASDGGDVDVMKMGEVSADCYFTRSCGIVTLLKGLRP